jgi:hypothetical protein
MKVRGIQSKVAKMVMEDTEKTQWNSEKIEEACVVNEHCDRREVLRGDGLDRPKFNPLEV